MIQFKKEQSRPPEASYTSLLFFLLSNHPVAWTQTLTLWRWMECVWIIHNISSRKFTTLWVFTHDSRKKIKQPTLVAASWILSSIECLIHCLINFWTEICPKGSAYYDDRGGTKLTARNSSQWVPTICFHVEMLKIFFQSISFSLVVAYISSFMKCHHRTLSNSFVVK